MHGASPPWQLDAVGLLRRYADGSLTPSAVMADALERIARLDPVLNAFTARADDILEAARRSDARWADRTPSGALDGVPVVVKDNLHVAGLPTSWGNAALAARRVDADELPVARLRAAGALLLGKANVPEFAVEGYTGNARYGVTRNPFDPALTPGGSSGGVVAAVAAGLAAVGLGTDGGGSIRRPAGYCGLVGLKPGNGSIARAGGLPQLLLDFEVVGPLTRSVRDARLMFDVLAGAHRDDPVSRTRAPAPARPLRRIHVVGTVEGAPVDPAVLGALEASASRFAALGCEVVRVEAPFDAQALDEGWTHIGEIGLAALFDTDPELEAAAGAKYRSMAERGRRASAPQLWRLLEAVRELRRDVGRAFGDVDALLMPTAAAMPWPAARAFPASIDGTEVGPRGHAVHTGWVNAVGHPALALPGATSGMPIGVQMIGDLGSEHALLDLGERYERDRGGFGWPTLASSP